MDLRIDPEFRDKIPPLTEDEYRRLEENIVSDGEIYEPIIVWNGTIVDGHNRWKIHLAHPEISYRTKEMDFPDKWAAFDWMYRKQLGRRNLTDEQRTYLLGKLYESRKKAVGFSGQRDEHGKFQCVQNGHNGESAPKRVSEKIADEMSIGVQTVKRAEHFSQGLDALKEVSPEAAQKVLEHKVNVPKATVAEVRNMDNADKKKFAESVVRGEVPTKPKLAKEPEKELVQSKPEEQKQELAQPVREQKSVKKPSANLALIENIYNDMVSSESVREYTVDDLISEIEENANAYVWQLRMTIANRSTLLTTAVIRTRVRNAIQKIQINIEKVSEIV